MTHRQQLAIDNLQEEHIFEFGDNWLNQCGRVAILYGFPKLEVEFIPAFISEYRCVSVMRTTPWDKLRKYLEESDNYDVFVWSDTDRDFLLANYARENSINIIHVENGFLGILATSNNDINPYSLIFDRNALYFNATESSDLEDILNNLSVEIDTRLSRQLDCLLNIYRSIGLAQINNITINSISNELGIKTRKRVLVLGQRENDILNVYGNANGWTSEKLLDLAIAENPDAQIYFLPSREISEELEEPYSLEVIATYDNVIILKQELILGELFSCIDHVYTITSNDGFGALLHGLKVTVVGMPFYAGWGLTDDRQINTRRTRKLSIKEIFYGVFLLYLKYGAASGDKITDCLATMLRIYADRQHAQLDQFTDEYIISEFNALYESKYWPILFRGNYFINYADKNPHDLFSISRLQNICKKSDSQLWQKIVVYIIVGIIIGKPAFYVFIKNIKYCINSDLYKEIIKELFYRYPSDCFLYLWGEISASEKNYRLAYESYTNAIEYGDTAEFIPPVERKKWGSIFAVARYEKSSRQLDKALRHYFDLLLSGYRPPEILCDLAEIANLHFDFETADRLFELVAIMQPTYRISWLHMQAARNIAAIPGRSIDAIKYLAICCYGDVKYVGAEIFGFNRNDEYFNVLPLESALCYIKTYNVQDKISLAYAFNTINQLEKSRDILDSFTPSSANILRCSTTKAMLLTLEGKYDQALELMLNMRKYEPSVSVYQEILRAGIAKGDYKLCGQILSEAEQKRVTVAETYRRRTFYGLDEIAKGYACFRENATLGIMQKYLGPKYAKSLAEIGVDDKSVFVVPSLGPGDEIISAVFYNKIAEKFRDKKLYFACEPRLQSLLQRSFSHLVFQVVKRRRTIFSMSDLCEYDKLPGSDLSIFFDNSGYQLALNCDKTIHSLNYMDEFLQDKNSIPGKPFLKSDDSAVSAWRCRIDKLANGRKVVGICWRSSLNTYLRNGNYLTVQELAPLFEIDDILFINLQYDECSDELDWIERNYPGKIINFENLDQFNDIDGVVSLMGAIDLIVSTCTLTYLLSGASGRHTFLLSNSSELDWYKKKGTNIHCMHETVHLIEGNMPGDKKSLVQNLVIATREFLAQGAIN